MTDAKENLPPPSSSPSPAPKTRILLRDPAWLLSPPPSVWNVVFVSITSPNVPVASFSATTPSAAPMTQPAGGAQANTLPLTTPARLVRTSLKDDHAPTLLLSVQVAQVIMTPASPNAHHALPPLMSRWTSTNFPLSPDGQIGLVFYFGCVGFSLANSYG